MSLSLQKHFNYKVMFVEIGCEERVQKADEAQTGAAAASQQVSDKGRKSKRLGI
jgi:hypothetical protein